MSRALSSGRRITGRVGEEPTGLILSDGGEQLTGREENKWACWQGRHRDSSRMNHNTNLVLLVECCLVLLVQTNLLGGLPNYTLCNETDLKN